MSAHRPRVLVVEDDASLQRFVALALEEFEIELLAVPSVDAGLAALADAPAALVLTDLMLPGRSGFELIDALAADPALRGGARLAVFSAGLNPQTRQRLERPEVWRLLSKPCSLAELQDCVRSALELVPASSRLEPAPPTLQLTDDEAAAARAIAEHFGGNELLYRAFRASCLQQFRADLAEGERARAAADAPALRRLAHSLKSVLLTLGHAQASTTAHALEDSCERADWVAAAPQWRVLRAQLEALH
jgi:CheY-like chemotaxis protein/HPt (histidine-containing phosphotransfer) domain-containing protein